MNRGPQFAFLLTAEQAEKLALVARKPGVAGATQLRATTKGAPR